MHAWVHIWLTICFVDGPDYHRLLTPCLGPCNALLVLFAHLALQQVHVGPDSCTCFLAMRQPFFVFLGDDLQIGLRLNELNPPSTQECNACMHTYVRTH